MLARGVGASSAARLLSALTCDTVHVCGIPAGGDEQSAEDHLARRRDGETTGLPDVHSIKGRVPSLCRRNVTILVHTDRGRTRADRLVLDVCFSEGSEVNLCS